MIEIKNLSKNFGSKQVLKDLNLKIEEGKVFGLVGINGSGKSTLLRLISGIYESEEGTVLVDNEVVYENEAAKAKIFFLPDDPYYENNTTPKSIIDLYKTYYNFDEKEYLDYINYFKLPLNKTMKNFSKGMKRQVFISLALAIKPKYLLLDEAFDGLDPLARLAFRKALAGLVEDKKTTIIISSHSLRELEDICDSYGLLDNMSISSFGDIDESINKVHKYQVAFKELPKEIEGINFIRYVESGRVVEVIVEEDYEQFEEKIKQYNPLLIDEIAIDFEELFIIEVERRGYLNEKNN